MNDLDYAMDFSDDEEFADDLYDSDVEDYTDIDETLDALMDDVDVEDDADYVDYAAMDDAWDMDDSEDDDEDGDSFVFDQILDGIMDEPDYVGDYEDRRRRRRWRRRRARRRAARRRRARARARRAAAARRARASRGRSAYRPPTSRRPVKQNQLKSSLDTVSKQIKKNASGIRTNAKNIAAVRKRVDGNSGRLDKMKGRVDSVVRVNRQQQRNIAQNQKTLKIDGALDLSQAVGFSSDANGDLGVDLDPTAAIKGAVKSGFIGKGSGFLSSPGGLAATAFLLSNYRSILGGIAGNSS